jgi:AbrB family looped-hinge helix DNA binding protein
MTMRTNIVIDDKLMADALKVTGARTKREVVELGLRTLIQLKQQERIRGFRGKLRWTGDLEFESMETTKLSSKGQVIIPKAVRSARRWEAGQELLVIDTENGVLLMAKAPFETTELGDVAGMLKDRVEPRTEQQIREAIDRDMRSRWRGRG